MYENRFEPDDPFKKNLKSSNEIVIATLLKIFVQEIFYERQFFVNIQFKQESETGSGQKRTKNVSLMGGIRLSVRQYKKDLTTGAGAGTR